MSVNELNVMRDAVIVNIEGGKPGDERLVFNADDGRSFIFYHPQSCCETVAIEDVAGDISDLLNSPIIQAEEVSNADEPECEAESYTWTFYKFATVKGSVTVRWLGTSNGYYSESVYFDVNDPNSGGGVRW